MKYVINDTATELYYCVAETEVDQDGNKYAGVNDFPYWSEDIHEAFDFR